VLETSEMLQPKDVSTRPRVCQHIGTKQFLTPPLTNSEKSSILPLSTEEHLSNTFQWVVHTNGMTFIDQTVLRV